MVTVGVDLTEFAPRALISQIGEKMKVHSEPQANVEPSGMTFRCEIHCMQSAAMRVSRWNLRKPLSPGGRVSLLAKGGPPERECER
jgi:hypothetical protein